jgi:hypothetical protein
MYCYEVAKVFNFPLDQIETSTLDISRYLFKSSMIRVYIRR